VASVDSVDQHSLFTALAGSVRQQSLGSFILGELVVAKEVSELVAVSEVRVHQLEPADASLEVVNLRLVRAKILVVGLVVCLQVGSTLIKRISEVINMTEAGCPDFLEQHQGLILVKAVDQKQDIIADRDALETIVVQFLWWLAFDHELVEALNDAIEH
jgi:hypothetical protein